jgi:HEAT repeat protein
MGFLNLTGTQNADNVPTSPQIDPPHRSNGLNTRPTSGIDPERPPKRLGAVGAGTQRSKLASRIDRVLNAALAGEPHVVLNAKASELLAEAVPVAAVISSALDRSGGSLTGQWRVTEAFRRSGLSDELFDSLASPDPLVRAAAARICGALRLTEAVLWIGDLVQDPDPKVSDAAVRALGQMGGGRAVDVLMASIDRVPMHRIAISLSHAATDMDIEALMRRPASEKAAVVTVVACGLRRDPLRIQPLLGIAHDRRWPKQVRLAACAALGMIGDPGSAEPMKRLADGDPDPSVKAAASRALRRLTGARTGSA